MAGKVKTFGDAGLDAGFLMSEAPGRVSREQIMLGARTTRTVGGTVLGANSTTQVRLPLAPAATDGTQTAASILFIQRDAATTAVRAVEIARGPAEVNGNLLIWPAGITAPQKRAAEAALAVKNIIVRY